MTLDDVDLFEVNESFAAIVLHYMRHFDLDPERVNVNGGAIAMGHPLGRPAGCWPPRCSTSSSAATSRPAS